MDIYIKTYNIIQNCSYRLYLVQATPIILLGPRTNIRYETELYLSLNNLINKQKGEKIYLCILSSMKKNRL